MKLIDRLLNLFRRPARQESVILDGEEAATTGAEEPHRTHPCVLCHLPAVRFGACESHLIDPTTLLDEHPTCARCGLTKHRSKFGNRKIGVHATGGFWMWAPTQKCDDCRKRKDPALRDPADYSTSDEPLRLRVHAKGKHHNLTPIFRRVSDYYQGEAKGWTITWGKFGCRTVQRRKSIRLGCCYSAHKTIVVHPLLDDPRVPAWYIEWLLHHEVLHVVHPPVGGSGGKSQIHHAEFRAAERKSPRYADAQHWEDGAGRNLWFSAPEVREAGKRIAARPKS